MSYDCPPEKLPRNERTQIVRFPLSESPPPLPAAVFTQHHERVRDLFAAAPSGAATVIAFYGGTELAAHAHAIPGHREASSIIIGRHEGAGLSLWRDATLALRHLLVRFWDPNAGRPPVDVLDLNSGQGFDLHGVGRLGAVAASGPIFVRVGRYDLLLVPPRTEPWPRDVALAWARVASPVELESDDIDRWLPRYDAPRHDTSVTGRLGPVSLTETSHPSANDVEPVAILGIQSPFGDGVVFPLLDEHLARGVLLGRYERCQISPSTVPALDCVSRVHALIIREGPEVVVYDTGSTHGTWVDGPLVTATALGERATLELARGNVVHWRDLAHLPIPAGGYVN